MEGWKIVVNTQSPVYHTILSVAGTDEVIVEGDLTDPSIRPLAQAGDWFRVITPYGLESFTGGAHAEPWKHHPREGMWAGYRYMTGGAEGSYYCMSRTYDIRTGRWTTPDPAASPWWNLQDYVGGNPLGGSDPSGLGTTMYDKVEEMTAKDKSYAAGGASGADSDGEVEEWHNRSIRSATRPEDGRKADEIWWWQRKALLKDQLETLKSAAANADCCICPEWLIAIWWDERVRMGRCEESSDDVGTCLGKDTSTGAFQMKGSTASSVIKWSGRYAKEFSSMTESELQSAMQTNLSFAAELAASRLCMILEGYRAAGWDPSKEGSISSAQLVGTLYSRGLGSPNNSPKSIKRGDQIAKWAEEAKQEFKLPECKCDCEPFAKKKN